MQSAAATLLKSSKKKAYDRLRAHCQKPGSCSGWSCSSASGRAGPRWVHAVPCTYIIYIGDPTALWALIAAGWAWVMANPRISTAVGGRGGDRAVGATARSSYNLLPPRVASLKHSKYV